MSIIPPKLFESESDPNEIPITIEVDGEKIQIGNLVFHESSLQGFVTVLGDIDVFPGERLTFSRTAKWEEVVVYSKALYPQGE